MLLSFKDQICCEFRFSTPEMRFSGSFIVKVYKGSCAAHGFTFVSRNLFLDEDDLLDLITLVYDDICISIVVVNVADTGKVSAIETPSFL